MAKAPTPVKQPDSMIDYQPISGLAVAALVISGISLVLLTIITGFAIYNRKPALAMEWLLPLGLGFVLSILARGHVQRSEGTRTGIKQATLAWWLSILGVAGFGAYMFATRTALSKDSNREAIAWFTDLKEQKLNQAFLKTQEPKLRQGISPDDEQAIDAGFGAGPLPAFRGSDLVRLFQDYGKDVEIESLGSSSYEPFKGGLQIENTFRLRSVEGISEITLRVVGMDMPEGREWYIRPGMVSRKTVTPYGRLHFELQSEASTISMKWLETLRRAPGHAYLLTLPEKDRNPMLKAYEAKIAPAQLMIAGGTFSKFLSEGYQKNAEEKKDVLDLMSRKAIFNALTKDGFFKFDGLTTDEKKKELEAAWIFGQITPPGSGGQEPPRLIVTADEIRLVFPVLMQVSEARGDTVTAKIIVAASSPALMEKVNALKAQGLNAADAAQNPKESVLASFPARDWRVVHLETAMERIRMPSAPKGGAPPLPPPPTPPKK